MTTTRRKGNRHVIDAADAVRRSWFDRARHERLWQSRTALGIANGSGSCERLWGIATPFGVATQPLFLSL
ncbi:hypothetical protein [Lysobacter sp. CCNWLW3]|uniref:hypothetical protein n=1 Tax=Lysobacter sp. CCNWLW3 TaxID=3117014 RepID=UPI002FCF32E1